MKYDNLAVTTAKGKTLAFVSGNTKKEIMQDVERKRLNVRLNGLVNIEGFTKRINSNKV